LYKRL